VASFSGGVVLTGKQQVFFLAAGAVHRCPAGAGARGRPRPVPLAAGRFGG